MTTDVFKFPENTEAEMATLGSILIDQEAIFKVFDFLSTRDFYSDRHQQIYEACLRLLGELRPIDIMLVSQSLEEKGQLENCGGRSYLAALTNCIPTSSNVVHYAKKVQEASLKRQLLVEANNAIGLVNSGEPVEDILSKAKSGIVKIGVTSAQDDSVEAVLREVEKVQLEFQDQQEAGKQYLGVPCGFPEIDKYVDGIRPGHIWVAGAWTSTGKTQFALNIVNNVLEYIPVSVISLEMGRVDTLSRLIGIRANLSVSQILKGHLTQSDYLEFKKSRDFFSTAPLQIHTTFFELDKIKLAIRKDAQIHGTKLFVLDYIQNIVSSTGKEYDTLTKSATELQTLAQELRITILIISQISNESQKGGGAGAGFKGTGTLEAVADLAIRLKRNKKTEAPQELCVPIEIDIVKNRHGYSGYVPDYKMWLASGRFVKVPTTQNKTYPHPVLPTKD